MQEFPEHAEASVRAYFSALTTGDIVEIRRHVDDDLYVRIRPGPDADGVRAFQKALERHINLTEDTEGFEIRHDHLKVEEAGATAWFEGRQRWAVEWEGKINRLKVHVSGVLERSGAAWKLVQLHAAPDTV